MRVIFGSFDSFRMTVLCVGLITLDLIYRVEQIPQVNQKCVAEDLMVVAGGPATNAAIAYHSLASFLDDSPRPDPPIRATTLLGCLGQHPLATLVRQEVESWGVTLLELSPKSLSPPPLSSIWVQATTGERTVVSLNATRLQADPTTLPEDILQGVCLVLIDGHQMAVGEAIARQARQGGIPVVVDGGSWKPGFEQVLQHCDVAIASANFFPPGCTTPSEVACSLQHLGVRHIAITRGAEPILVWEDGQAYTVAVPAIQPVDTLGAGDIFHGAFCHAWLQGLSLATALTQAAEIAAIACGSVGTRKWISSSELQNKFKSR